jgi:hypothetical protein
MRLINRKGFSLPELTIALGLMGGISLVTMKLIDEQKSNEAYLRGRTEISKAVSVLKNALNDTENCRKMLAGVDLDTASTSLSSLEIPIKSSPTNFMRILEANKTYNGFRTTTITVSAPAGSPPNTARVELNFRIKSRNMKLWGDANDSDDRIITERIPLIITKNAANVITDCGPVVSEANLTAKQKFCQSLGGAAQWDSVNSKCVFRDMTCGYGKVPTRLTSLGGVICEDIKNKIDLNQLFDSTQCTTTGKFRIIEVGGKLKIDCPP